jgi:hypothetical protein
MQARVAHLVEAYLVLDQPRQRVGHWTQALAPLDEPHAPALAQITAYYDPDTDQALLGLRYDELALGDDKLSFVIELALLAEIGMIQPAALTEGDRRRFLGERLARCSISVPDHRTVLVAYAELVKKIRDRQQTTKAVIGAVPRSKTVPKPSAKPAARAMIAPRTISDDELPDIKAKGTRSDLSPQTPTTTRLAPTIPATPAKLARSTRDELETTANPRPPQDGRTINEIADTEPYPIKSGPTPPGIIYARYLRSGRWVPIRIGALSLKGAALLSGALPRLNDHVDLAFAYADHRVLVRGGVKKVSTVEETAQTGAATFSVQFELDDASRRQLTTLLTAARAAQVTIKPPPPRSTRRYPVEWPVCLGTMRGAVRADALDISYGGMFVRPAHPLTIDSTINFSIVLDDGAQPISGRSKVVRHVTDVEARTCGLVAGYGLHISDMGDLDLGRWMRFLTRIEQRADKRVLIGATPQRLVELQASLAAIGYAVSGGTDPGALVQLAGAERPVDAVLLDGDWLPAGSSTGWIESLFSARKVPCVTLHGDAKRGRSAIDKLLSIA